MMNSTNFIPSQQSLAAKLETAPTPLFPMTEADAIEFERLMRKNEQSADKIASRDDGKRNDTEPDGSFSDMGGMAMNLRSIELNAPQNLPKPAMPKPVHESSGRSTEIMAGERIERKDGDTQEDQDQPAKAEVDETSDSVEVEESPDNQVVVESVEKEETSGEPQVEIEDLALDHETVDDLDTEEIMEVSELNPEIDQIDESSGENPILEPEAEMEPEAEKDLRLQQNAQRSTPGAQKPKSTGMKGEPALAPALDGTKIAPNQQSMLNTAKNVATMESSASENVSADTTFDMSEGGSDQFGGTSMDFSENTREIPQPVLNVQGVTATGQLSGVTPTIFPSASPQMTALLETIWNRVTTFRARGDSSWTVQIRPDDHTRMQLTIKMGATGLEILTRLQQGDMARLGSSWGDLQNALSERGVQLHDLESEEAQSEDVFDMEMFGNDEEAASSEAGDRDLEEGFAPIGPVPDDRPKTEARPRSASSHDGFEHWA